MLVEQVIRMFGEYLQDEDMAKSSIRSYLTSLRLFATWYEQSTGESFVPDSVTPLDIQDYRSYLNTNLKQAPTTINKKLTSLKSFWKFAVEKKLSQINPTTKIKLKRTSVQNIAPRWLTRKEQSRFLHEVEKEHSETLRIRNRAIIHLMLSAGLRVDEVVSLTLDDLNLPSRVVTVRSGKGNKFRIVYFQKTLQEYLKNWLAVRSDDESNPFLFPSRKSPKITTRMVNYFVQEYAERAKIEGMSCHNLRHSFCKNLINAGNPIELVAQLAGHESIETTRRYVTASERDLRAAIDKIEQ